MSLLPYWPTPNHDTQALNVSVRCPTEELHCFSMHLEE